MEGGGGTNSANNNTKPYSSSNATRSNPLYNASTLPPPPPPSSQNRFSSWSRSNKSGTSINSGTTASANTPPRHNTTSSSAFSDTASTPPDSPARFSPSRTHTKSQQHANPYYAPSYENPGYTVETPGLSESGNASPYRSPYRAPPYFVQTPAQSDKNALESPYSSAPPSPLHAASDGTNRKKSKRSKSSSAGLGTNSSDRLTAISIGKIIEEDEYYPDPSRDSARRRRFWKCCLCWSGVLLVALLAAGATVAWFLFEPKAPTYSFQSAYINQFLLVGSRTDANGLPTDELFANISLTFQAYNNNKLYSVRYGQGVVRLGYSSMGAIMQAELPSFKQDSEYRTNFTTSAATLAYPLYGAGPAVRSAMVQSYLSLNMNVAFKSSINVVWKILSSSFTQKMNCQINIDPVALTYLNSTCGTSSVVNAPK